MCRRRNSINTCLVDWTNEPIGILLFGKSESTTAGSQHHANRTSLFQRERVSLQIRIVQGFACGSQSQRYGARNMLSVLRIKLGFPIEVLHLRGNLYWRS